MEGELSDQYFRFNGLDLHMKPDFCYYCDISAMRYRKILLILPLLKN